ncbi:MAG: ArsC/Spx/MgsR family protein [Mangrovibacterium sp.]
MSLKIYHHPRCAKSRMALQFLEEYSYVPELINYMKEGLRKEELEDLVAKTGLPIRELVRTSDALFKDNHDATTFTEEMWFDLLVNNPSLLRRPIVINGNKAVVANPAELIDSIL